MLAPCGLDCSSCSIRLIPIDPDVGQEAIDWFIEKGWLKETEGIKEAIEKKMYCNGCRGDRSDAHWSPNCVILKCCIDEKKHVFCNECGEFPCKKLLEWGEMSPHHEKAIMKLKNMRIEYEK